MKTIIALLVLAISPPNSWAARAPKLPKDVRVSCADIFVELIHSPELQAIMNQYGTFNSVTKEDNHDFIELAKKANTGEETDAKLFFVAENAILKELNDDVTGNKDIVTALDNLYKARLWSAIQKDPLLKQNGMADYSDFKALCKALASADEDIQNRLSFIVLRVNHQYEDEIRKIPESAQWLKNARGLAAHPSQWHLTGMGTTPDQAWLASRYARSVATKTGQISPMHFTALKAFFSKKIDEAENLRKVLAFRFYEVPGVMTHSAEYGTVLSTEAIEVLKKVTPTERTLQSWLNEVKRDLRDHFKRDFNTKDILTMRDYMNAVDVFSLGLLQEERVVINLGEAQAGIITADFRGQGAKNAQETMKALSGASGKELDKAIRKVREGEGRATDFLVTAKERFEKAMKEIDGPKAAFTGDDGYKFPASPLSLKQKEELIRTLAKEKETISAVRVTMLPQTWKDSKTVIPANVRSTLIVEAETLEKDLRKELYRKGLGDLANKTLIVVEYNPRQAGRVAAGIWTTQHDGVHASNQLARDLQETIEQFLKDKGIDQQFVKNL